MASAESPKHDRKLAEILSAAAEVFAEQGYDRASIRMVAERAGISVPGTYHYIRSKQDLLFLIQHRVFHDLVEQYKEDSRAESDPEARLELLIRNHLKRFLENLPELIVCSREIHRLEGTFRERVQVRQREYFTLALHLFMELADHYGSSSVDPRTATLAMFGSINWVHTWYRPGTGLSAERMAADFARVYLRGMLPDEGTPRQEVKTIDSVRTIRPHPSRRGAG